MMKLLTQKIIDTLPSLYPTDSIFLEDKRVICTFFTPDSHWTWFVFSVPYIERQLSLPELSTDMIF